MTPLTPDINLGRLFKALMAERDMAISERDRYEQQLGVLTMRHLELIGIIKALVDKMRQIGEPTEEDYTETEAIFCRMAETALHHYSCLLDDEEAAAANLKKGTTEHTPT